jgi:hypothetical protein
MSDVDERLIVMLEARIAEFERRMAAAEKRGTRTYNWLAKGSKSATRQMEADMLTATARINQALASTSAKIGAFAKAFIAGAVGAAVAGLGTAARGAVRNMADLADQADRIGLNVETFQGLRQGLQLSGVAANEAGGALENFAQRLGDAAAGQGDLYRVLSQSGIAIRNQAGELRDTADVLRDFADLVQSAATPAERMALVTDAFGKGGKAMVLAMSEGSAGIDAMIEKAREAGVVIDEHMIRQAAELDDQFDLVAAQIEIAFQRGVISAAEFFGFIESRSLQFFGTMDNYRAILEEFGSADTAAAIAGGWQELEAILTQGNAIEILQGMRAEFDQLEGTITRGGRIMGSELRQLHGEFPVLAEAISEMYGHVFELGNKLQEALNAGDVEAAQRYSAELEIAVANLEQAVQGAADLSDTDLSGAVAWAASLAATFGDVAAAARDAAAAAREVPGMDTGTPLSGSADGLMPPSVEGVTTSPRPRRAPPMLGESGGAGGGGGGSSRIEALLADLKTEREILTAWYAESLDLLNGATDAELAAIGGRHEALERLEAEHMERLRGIRDESQGGILADAETFFGEMASAFAAGGDRMVKIGRVFGALEAAINVGRAQAQVLADPALPWWRKIPAMLSISAAGAKVVASIRGGGSAGGGGGGASSGGAGRAAGSARAPEGPLRVLLEGVEDGRQYEGAALRRMFDALSKEAGDRGMIFAGRQR